MKRTVRSRSGREMYGPKWQNMESTKVDDDSASTELMAQTTTAASLPLTQTNCLTPQAISRRRICVSNSHQSMYRATVEGDCVAVEMLLEGDPKLASDEISEEGDRALHVAAAIKHKQIVQKIVQKLSPSDLTLLDGHGHTACCYAAISGTVDIADLMIRKHQSLATARDSENKTPLYKAAFRGNAKMVLYFLESAKVEDLSMEEWFDLLLVTIRREMYDVALKISGCNDQLATMRNDEGTVLHLLAKQRFFKNRMQRRAGVMRVDFGLLANKLWESIQRLGKDSAVELMKKPAILHDAAQVGNVEFITLLTHTYPELAWHTNSEGYTIFHIAIRYRQETLFGLIEETGARKDLIAVSQDESGNNILHLAAKLGLLDPGVRMLPTFRLHMEMMWFKEVKAIVPPFCLEMRNKDGHTPSELFDKEHKSLMEKSATWIRNTADSWLLISTLVFSVVFASAFAMPGGYNQNTGIPILFKSKAFTYFIYFEALAMFFSAFSVLQFSRTMMASDQVLLDLLPDMRNGLACLSLSVFSAISVFMSAYFLVYLEERTPLVTSLVIILYIVLTFVIFIHIYLFHFVISCYSYPKRKRHSLFKRHAYKASWRHQTTHKVFGFY